MTYGRVRAITSVGVSGVALALVLGVLPAQAHPGDPHQPDEQHAAQDLAGVSMEKIEKDTRANAREIQNATGEAPGGRTADQDVANQQASDSAGADPGKGGRWSPVTDTPVVPVFQAVLPNGKVLMWDSVGDEPAEGYTDHTFTRAAVWNPRDDTYKRVDVTGYNIFCAGYAQLADGRVLVAGGNQSKELDGIVQTHLFDWRTESWSRGPDMSAERWYPSVAALGSGEALIVAGGPATAEVYQTDGKLRRLTGFSSYAARIYPFLVPRPDGKVEMVGPGRRMDTMSVTGSGALAASQTRDGINRDYGSFATYAIGKALVAGGGKVDEGGQSSVPTRTATVVDVNGTTTKVSQTSPMSVGRRQFSLTVLADGSVLATGGQSSSVSSLVDLENPVFAAERWDPTTGSWTVLDSAARVRQYHAGATLLPDGRVLTGGGGICGSCQQKGYLEKNLEYFSPPYLYAKDGSGTPAARPVIEAVPDVVGYARQFAISSAQAGSIGKVGLVRLGASTHGVDQGQRYVPLQFSTAGSVVTATAPATPDIAPPGHYMLFVTDRAGVPSVAKIIKLDPRHVPRPPTSTSSDYDGDGRRDPAVWRPGTGEWHRLGGSPIRYGIAGDIPVAADFGGDGKTDIAVWRPSTGRWYIRGVRSTTYGIKNDQPVQADYDGDGRSEVAIWRPSTGRWYVQGRPSVAYGVAGDIPVPADYDGDGKADLAVWRPSTGKWYVKGQPTTTFGIKGDRPVQADYDGNGRADRAVWRPSTGRWYIAGQPTTALGRSTDQPVQGDYNGDGRTDVGIWERATGTWRVPGSTPVQLGRDGDHPV